MKTGSLNTLAWQRIKNNKLAFLSLCYIVLLVCVAIFAVLISPDSSPNANEMHIELATQKPLTRVLFLEIPKQEIVEISFLKKMIIKKEIFINRLFLIMFQLMLQLLRKKYLVR